MLTKLCFNADDLNTAGKRQIYYLVSNENQAIDSTICFARNKIVKVENMIVTCAINIKERNIIVPKEMAETYSFIDQEILFLFLVAKLTVSLTPIQGGR